MRNFSFFLVASLFVVSCSFSEVCPEMDVTKPFEVDVSRGPNYISQEEALKSLDSFFKIFEDAPVTKANENSIERSYSKEDVYTINRESLLLDTKAEAPLNIPDTLAYVVNFIDDNGFAVLSADNRIGNGVLCFIESGYLSPSMLSKINEEDDCIRYIETNQEVVSSEDELSVFISILRSAILGCFGTGQQVIPDPEAPAIGGGGADHSPKYGPLLSTKWSQCYIGRDSLYLFNKYTPNNAACCCVVTAVAQILLHNDNFVFHTSDNVFCYRDTMVKVAHYTAPHTHVSEEAEDQAAHFVRDLGRSFLCDVSYGNSPYSASSSTAQKAKDTFEAFGYNDVTVHTGFGNSNQALATNMIRNGLPVYLSGCKSPSLSGHAWVLDGDNGDYYHINWGWNGLFDGYFIKGTFSAANSFSIDSEYDSNVELSSPDRPYYDWTFRLITYSL